MSAPAGQDTSTALLPPAGARLVLVLIGLAAVVLRFSGLSWGLPYPLHPDENVILARVATMSWGNLNPGFFMYPGFFIYQVFGLERAIVALGGDARELIYAARLVTATYSVATVWLVYLLAGRLGGRRLAMLAAGMTAAMGALTLHAHYAVTDTPAAALATATLWLAVRAWQRDSYVEMGFAAVIAGLAVSTKYSVAPICFIPWLGWMSLAARDHAPLVRRVSATVLLASLSIGAFLLTSPFTLLDYESFLDDIAVESHLQARSRAGYHVDPLDNPDWRDRGVTANAVAAIDDLGPVAFVAALGAILYLLAGMTRDRGRFLRGLNERGASMPPATDRRDIVPGAMLVVWVVLYFAFMAPSALGGQRYMLPIYPALMLLAAVGIGALVGAAERAGRSRWMYVGIGVLILAAVGPPLATAVSSTRLLAQRDTRLVARDWIVANLERRSHLAREFYAPPIHTSDDFRLSQPFSLTEHPLETYCKEAVDFLILSSLNATRYLESDADRFAEERAWYERLDTRTRVVHRIDGKGAVALHHPTIEIRRLFCSADPTGEEIR
jgi:4-amino-4-deoxy-L-arabinose transferase-like glycosyltransferase